MCIRDRGCAIDINPVENFYCNTTTTPYTAITGTTCYKYSDSPYCITPDISVVPVSYTHLITEATGYAETDDEEILKARAMFEMCIRDRWRASAACPSRARAPASCACRPAQGAQAAYRRSRRPRRGRDVYKRQSMMSPPASRYFTQTSPIS